MLGLILCATQLALRIVVTGIRKKKKKKKKKKNKNKKTMKNEYTDNGGGDLGAKKNMSEKFIKSVEPESPFLWPYHTIRILQSCTS
jgi:hypothetical protein